MLLPVFMHMVLTGANIASFPYRPRHADREAEPKDYDVCNPDGKRDLLKATYTRIGNFSGVGG